MGVNPMLETVNDGHPWEKADNAFKMRLAGAIGLGCGIKFFEEFIAEQFHGHGSHFAKLNRRAAISIEVLPARGLGVKSMAGLVQDRFDVPLHANGIHED